MNTDSGFKSTCIINIIRDTDAVMQLRLPDRLCHSLINASLDIICSFCIETIEKVGLGRTPPPGNPQLCLIFLNGFIQSLFLQNHTHKILSLS